MRNRRRLLSYDDDTRDIWPAFTDVMTTMSLILSVLVLLAYVKNLVSSKRLDAYQRQIATSEQKLRLLGGDLRRMTAEIEAGKSQLEYLKITIEQGRVTALTVDAGDTSGSPDLVERVSFSFNKIEVEYVPQGKDGLPQGGMTFADQWSEQS